MLKSQLSECGKCHFRDPNFKQFQTVSETLPTVSENLPTVSENVPTVSENLPTHVWQAATYVTRQTRAWISA